MGASTHIQWCDMTFNPWIGCTKVSPGCAHCYAERDFDLRKHIAKWGAGQLRHRTSAEYWRQPLRWQRTAARYARELEITGRVTDESGDVIVWHRPRVFVASLADVFDPEVPAEWRRDLFFLITQCHSLDFLLLTKRPHLVEQQLKEISTGPVAHWDLWGDWQLAGGLPNVWLGTTVEDQARADERIPALLSIPARMRFLSCEPLLGPVDLSFGNPKWRTFESYHAEIHWVICGGESGPQAWPMHPDWARSLRDQCAAVSVPFLFKQWGEWSPRELVEDTRQDSTLKFFPNLEMTFARVGKHGAGRLLDGREHNEFPEVRS